MKKRMSTSALIEIRQRIRKAVLSLSLLGLASGLPLEAHAKTGGTGLGIVFGEPTGITAKFWQGSRNAIAVGLAYSFDDFGLIYGDYLWQFPGAFGGSTPFAAALSPYVGVGGELFFGSRYYRWDRDKWYRDGSSAGLGLRIPLGLEWRPGNPPLGVFVELVPGIGLIPGMFGFFQGGLGARYYF